mgnify:CR=1 FL=1
MESNAYYVNLSTGEREDCFVSLEQNNLHLYFPGGNKGLIIWSITKLDQCTWYGADLHVHAKNTGEFRLEAKGELAKQIHERYLNPVIAPENNVPLYFQLAPLLMTGLVVIGIGLALYFYALPTLKELLFPILLVASHSEELQGKPSGQLTFLTKEVVL